MRETAGRADPLPNRAEAARLARDAGVLPAAIQSVLDEQLEPGAESWSVLAWANRMQARQFEIMPNTGQLPRTPRQAPPPKPSAPASGRRPSAPPGDDLFAPDHDPPSRASVHESGEIPREIGPDQAQEVTAAQRRAALAAAKGRAKH